MLKVMAVSLILSTVAFSMAQVTGGDEAMRLHDLRNEDWQWRLENYPESAAWLGDRRDNDRLTDYHTKPKDLMAGYSYICKRADGELPKLFAEPPRTPYGLREIAAFEAPAQTTACDQPGAADGSRAGAYFINPYNAVLDGVLPLDLSEARVDEWIARRRRSQ